MAIPESVAAKLGRVREHIAAAQEAVERFLATEPYELVRQLEAGGARHVYRFSRYADPPPTIALRVGDAVHNLRSSLDHMALALAQAGAMAARTSLTQKEEGQVQSQQLGAHAPRKHIARGCVRVRWVRTYVYIDAFNLYHGRLEDTPYRWLDIVAFARAVAPAKNTVEHVHLFSGEVTKSPPNDPFRHIRQATYFRALATLPGLTLHKTRFVTHIKTRRLVTPLADGTTHAQVYVTEEKEADVLLGAQLLADGFSGAYEAAILVTNDSDLRGPAAMVWRLLRIPVGVSNPFAGTYPDMIVGQFRCRPITPALLTRCQLPPTVVDAQGSFSKPGSW